MTETNLPDPIDSVPEDPNIDQVRRKLLRSTAVLGGAFAAGQLPYSSPVVKSFFGTRTAWAQPSVMAPVVAVTQPANSPIVIITNALLQNPVVAGASTAPGEFKDETFTIENVGTVPVEFRTPSITGSGAAAFSIEGAALNGIPDMAPIPMQPGDTVTVTVRFTCGTVEEGVVTTATIVLDIVPLEGTAPVEGVTNVAVSGVCGTLGCGLECVEVESETCIVGRGGLEIDLFPGGEGAETFNVRNVGTLALNVVSVTLQAPLPEIDFTPATGVIQPGEALLQTASLACAPTDEGSAPTTVPQASIIVEAESVDLVDGAPVPGVDCRPGLIRAFCFDQ